MGLGHVPKEPIRAAGEGADVQGRQRRGTAAGRAVEQPSLANRARGQYGEDLVARWYQDNGWVVVARNWRNREGEIDIIARRPGTVVVCEVKARASALYGGPASAVGYAKQQRLRRLALAYLSSAGVHEVSVRFDVACVVGSSVEVIEAAF